MIYMSQLQCKFFSYLTVLVIFLSSGEYSQSLAKSKTVVKKSSFVMLRGSWRGSGSLHLKGGHREQVRCTSKVKVVSAGRKANQTIRCINPRYQVYFVSSAINSGGRITGSWSDKRNGTNGEISGNIKGQILSLRLTTQGQSASLNIHVTKCRQSMNLRSYSGDIERINVVLRKKC